ncbi:MAG: hypothetical protein HQ526_03165 [Actinobacteria bacterium]|nr:hypothetical protein [Actinomycetota bacterium]
MSDYPRALDKMLAAWNEQHPELIRAHLVDALATDVRFVDPSIDLVGLDMFEANIRKTQQELPGAIYSRTSSIDSQHSFHRYHWAIHLNGKLILPGFDVTRVDESGQITDVIGFFGEFP